MTTKLANGAVAAEPGRAGADRVAWLQLERADVLLLADGAGNSSEGARAAEVFVSVATAAARAARQPESADYWLMVLRSIDSTVANSCDGGLTTGVVAVCGATFVCGASVGDSAAWLADEGGLTRLVGATSSGSLLGTGRSRPRSFRAAHGGRRVVLTSDGVHKYVEQGRLTGTLAYADLEQSVRATLAATLDGSDRRFDDASLVLWEQLAEARGSRL